MKYKICGILSSYNPGLFSSTHSVLVVHLSCIIAMEGKNLGKYLVSQTGFPRGPSKLLKAVQVSCYFLRVTQSALKWKTLNLQLVCSLPELCLGLQVLVLSCLLFVSEDLYLYCFLGFPPLSLQHLITFLVYILAGHMISKLHENEKNMQSRFFPRGLKLMISKPKGSIFYFCIKRVSLAFLANKLVQRTSFSAVGWEQNYLLFFNKHVFHTLYFA